MIRGEGCDGRHPLRKKVGKDFLKLLEEDL